MQDRCGNRRIRIGENDVAAVDACCCGVLQLHLGTFTVRFTEDGLLKLHQALDAALRRLELLPVPNPEPKLLLGMGRKSGSA